MTEEETNEPQEDFAHPEEPPLPVSEENIEPINREPDAPKQTEATDDINEKTQQRLFDLQEQQIGATKNANKIAIAASVINVFMIIVTFLLFRVATQQSAIAIKAANAATASVEQSILSNKIAKDNYDLARETFLSDNVATDKSYDVARKSLDAQMQFIKENHEQFLTQMETLLEIKDLKLIKFAPGEPLQFDFNAYNVSQQPLKLLGGTNSMVISDPKAAETYFQNSAEFDTTSFITYLSKDYPRKVSVITTNKVTKPDYDLVKKKDLKLYFLMDIKYVNLSTKRNMRYLFKAEMNLQTKDVTVTLNENFPADKR